MKNHYITSDLHFGHRNILRFCPNTRAKYGTVENMNEQMILEWNTIVQSEDLVYILGDVAFMSGYEASKIMNRLNGSKILIKGNHDVKALKDLNFRNSFTEVHEYLEISHNGVHCCLFHYPIAEFNRQHRGAVHFHGHLHGSPSGLTQYRVRDVGMDATGKIAWALDDAIADALCGKIKGHQSGE